MRTFSTAATVLAWTSSTAGELSIWHWGVLENVVRDYFERTSATFLCFW